MSQMRARMIWSGVAGAAIAVSVATFYAMTHPALSTPAVASQAAVSEQRVAQAHVDNRPTQVQRQMVASPVPLPPAPTASLVASFDGAHDPETREVSASPPSVQPSTAVAALIPAPAPVQALQPRVQALVAPVSRNNKPKGVDVSQAAPLATPPVAEPREASAPVTPIAARVVASVPQREVETVTVTAPVARTRTYASVDAIGRGNSVTITLPRKARKQKG
jgi:hypothetical protein